MNCAYCQRPIMGEAMQNKDGQPVHAECYEKAKFIDDNEDKISDLINQ